MMGFFSDFLVITTEVAARKIAEIKGTEDMDEIMGIEYQLYGLLSDCVKRQWDEPVKGFVLTGMHEEALSERKYHGEAGADYCRAELEKVWLTASGEQLPEWVGALTDARTA